ncbi:hypothetical protein MSAS_34510 [Mycobacterium saskatchewanense]|nr:hypothetical protein MSAS_34510 [Mycobacterium saskatchewanense]
MTKPSSVANFANCFVAYALSTTERAIRRDAKGKPYAIHDAKGRNPAHDFLGPRGLRRFERGTSRARNVAVNDGPGDVTIGDFRCRECANGDLRGSQ